MYSQTILDEIRDRVSIAALIGERIPLKKAGRNHKGLCPFHSEKTPSFMVSDEKQIYHCFGCGEGGNVFNFFMKFDGLSFMEAVEMLATRAGVTLPKLKTVDKKGDDEILRRKKWAYRLNKLVAEYFNNNLKDSKKGTDACNYLKSRDIFSEKNTQHFLGYAEDSWDGMVKFLESKNVPLDLAVEVGVIKRREGGGYYDFFRHRIIFPVIVPGYKGDNIVAFSGRTFGEPKTSEGREAPAKYLNSPDSIIYHKSYTVYGLNVALDAIRKEDRVILVEGNLDVMRLQQEGIKNTVAPLGTALTAGHLKSLTRYTRNFVVVFDGDDAGYKAAARSLPLFLEIGLVPRVVPLPKGEDPDSFVRSHGSDALCKMIDGADTLFEWIIDDTVAKYGTKTDGKVKAMEELKPFFAMVKNPVEVASYKKRLASRLGMDESVIVQALKGNMGIKKTVTIGTGSASAERLLLELMLTYPETVEKIYADARSARLNDESYQTVFDLILAEFEKDKKVDVVHIAEKIADDELKNEVLELALAENKYDEPIQAAHDCINFFKRSQAKQKLQELTLAVQGKNLSNEKMSEYMKEIQKITGELHNFN